MVAHIDHVDTLEAVEFMGRFTSMKRLARVTGLESTDYGVLATALNEAGIPQSGTYLDENDVNGENLILVSRTPRLFDRDKGAVDVLLDYDHVLNGPYQNLFNGDGQHRVYGKFQSSLNEVETNRVFIYDMQTNRHPDIITRIGKTLTIVLTYTVPAGSSPRAGQTIKQGGKIKVFQPQSNFQIDGYIDTTTPWTVEGSLLGRINENDGFLGGLRRTWLCSEVQYSLMAKRSPLDESKPRYKFHVEWNYNPEGWTPEVVFIDPATNRPPVGNLTKQLDNPRAIPTTQAEFLATGEEAVYGYAGQVRVFYFFEMNFGTYFGVNFEGS